MARTKHPSWKNLVAPLFGGAIAFIVAECLFDVSDIFIPVAGRLARGTDYESNVIRWHLSRKGDPVERALARREIEAGQSVEDIIAKHGPFRVTTAGRYQELEPPQGGGLAFESYRIIAKDGRLVGAAWWTCTGQIEFFNTLPEGGVREANEQLRAERRRQAEAKWEARMGVAGFAAIYFPWDYSSPSDHPDEQP